MYRAIGAVFLRFRVWGLGVLGFRVSDGGSTRHAGRGEDRFKEIGAAQALRLSLGLRALRRCLRGLGFYGTVLYAPSFDGIGVALHGWVV